MLLPRKAALGITGDTVRRSVMNSLRYLSNAEFDSVQESRAAMKRLTVKGEVVYS
jgi:hypothetical protein